MILTRREFLRMDKEQIKNIRASKEAIYNLKVGLVYLIDIGEGLNLISPACKKMREMLPDFTPINKCIINTYDNHIKAIVFQEKCKISSMRVCNVYNNGFTTVVQISFFKVDKMFIPFKTNKCIKPEGKEILWGNAWEFFGE